MQLYVSTRVAAKTSGSRVISILPDKRQPSQKIIKA